jgi:hypothetical protein
MNTLTRWIGVALTAALLATTAIAPMASARQYEGEQRQQAWHGEQQRSDWHGAPQQRSDWHGEQHRDNGGDNGAGLALGLGVAALAGVAIWNASQAPAPVYQPVYPQPSYGPALLRADLRPAGLCRAELHDDQRRCRLHGRRRQLVLGEVASSGTPGTGPGFRPAFGSVIEQRGPAGRLGPACRRRQAADWAA